MGDAMRSCPECGDLLHYSAKGCSCGWRMKVTATPVDTELLHKRSVNAVSAKVRVWLLDKGLARGEDSTQDYMQRLADYRDKLKRTSRPDMQQWARDILQRNEDGEMVPIYSLSLAREAMKGGTNEAV